MGRGEQRLAGQAGDEGAGAADEGLLDDGDAPAAGEEGRQALAGRAGAQDDHVDVHGRSSRAERRRRAGPPPPPTAAPARRRRRGAPGRRRGRPAGVKGARPARPSEYRMA